ncbi:MAG: FAD-dependent oxidoreductase, partial [Actinomycetota bacterium]|nr:FAD-dependent oxidoreductase [Actinomycetota bacterium]
MRDPDRLVYFREDVGGLVFGGYERDPVPWSVRGVPADFNNRLLPPDWDRFLPLAEPAGRLVPAIVDAEVVRLVNGPEAFTPDGEFLLGETEVRGLHVAAGFCAHGIAGAGGVGKVAAERSRGRVVERATEVYATYYDVLYPNHERTSGRPLRVPAVVERHRALGAVFGEKAGWERVNWYASNEDPAHEHFRPSGWSGRNWSTAIVTEHLATRATAGLFDESSFSKLEVTGPGAADLLERCCANRVARGVGAVTYTQLLNTRAGIECDLTVTRQGNDRFFLVTGTAFGGHDESWLQRHVRDDEPVSIRDVTSSRACFALWGPAARAILSPLTGDDLGFGYMAARPITVADVPLWALRVTYVGELGWELYAAPDLALHLWDALVDAGTPHGLVPGGYRAIDSLRLEKGYRVWSSDITPDRDPLSAGLGFAVRTDKPGGFLGRDAVVRIAASPPSEVLCCL